MKIEIKINNYDIETMPDPDDLLITDWDENMTEKNWYGIKDMSNADGISNIALNIQAAIVPRGKFVINNENKWRRLEDYKVEKYVDNILSLVKGKLQTVQYRTGYIEGTDSPLSVRRSLSTHPGSGYIYWFSIKLK